MRAAEPAEVQFLQGPAHGVNDAMTHTYTSLYTHVTFSTSRRKPLITDPARLHAYLCGITRELRAHTIIVGGVKDHVHMLVETRPTVALSELVGVVKGNSSKWMNETFGRSFAWQRGFGAFSVSKSNLDTVTEYIRDQERHHQVRSFEEEFKALLARNHVEYDPQFLWK
ncbi:MAG TPA: IS200/IS605 family transposase [Thermoanaerobaculia bacterium]|nr:IS200/IS605 family transposase [Thermoanaerobaculia bacterium]